VRAARSATICGSSSRIREEHRDDLDHSAPSANPTFVYVANETADTFTFQVPTYSAKDRVQG
jgi:hypothetical protein